MNQVAIGIDIGGTNTVFGFINREGKCLVEDSIPTQKHGEIEKYLEELFSEIDKHIACFGPDLEIVGIGIGAPNGNFYNGTIEHAGNLRWDGVIPLAQMVEDHFKVPTFLTNDANAAAIGEMIYGGAKGMKNFMVITLGTGLGSGIVVNGELLYGHDGFAGEVGHMLVRPGGRHCGCGRRGCLETYVSATGVKRTAQKLMAKYREESVLRDVPFNQLNAKLVNDAATGGDKIAIETFEYTGQMLGLALANAVAVTNPEAIFLFGGLAKAGDLIFKPTQHHMEENMLNIFKNKVKLLPSGLKSNAAILGASALVWKELENDEKFLNKTINHA
ncbi:MAG: ROK family protein [Marinifilaceae bacterium]